MAIQSTTQITSVINSEFIMASAKSAHAVSVFIPGGVGRPFISVADLRGKGTLTASWPVEPTALTAFPVAEGVDHVTSQQITLTDLTAQVQEFVAITTITDLAAMVSLENEIERTTRMLGNAHGNKIDAVLMALFASLATNAATSGSDLTWTLTSTGIQNLSSTNFVGPYAALIHNIQFFDLMKEGTVNIGNAAGPLGEKVRTSYDVFEVASARLIMSPNIPLTNSGLDRSGVLFSGEPAFGLAELQWLEMSEERDNSLRALEITSVSTYQAALIRDAAANELASGLT